jgi:hypothetical protein
MQRFFLAVVLFICFASSLVSCKKEEPKNEALYPNIETSQTPERLGQELF